MAYNPLFFQHKNARKRSLVWAKIGGLSLGLHLCVLIFVFFVYKDTKDIRFNITASLIQSSAQIMFKPDIKKPVVKKSSVTAIKPPDDPPSVPLPRPPIVPKTISKAMPRQGVTFQKQQAVEKQQNNIKKITQVPAAHAKIEQPKVLPTIEKINQVEKTKPVEKKVIPAKQEIKKIETPKLQDSKAEIQKPIEKEKDQPALVQAPMSMYIEPGVAPEGLRGEYALFHKQLSMRWSPPVGIRTESSCSLQITVDWKGIVQHISTLESSGILMFDMAAQSVIREISMPRWTWGKVITITFKQ